MASLSQYASRFLSSGMAVSMRPGTGDDEDAGNAGDPLFYSQASVSGAPFSHPNHQSHPYGPDYSLTSSDGLPAPPSTHARPLNQSGILQGLASASRFGTASLLPQQGKSRASAAGVAGVRDSMIREMDDEEDVDLWTDERRMDGIASDSTRSDAFMDSVNHLGSNNASTRPRSAFGVLSPRHSSAADGEAQDPFLADGDLDNDEVRSVVEGAEKDIATETSSIASPTPASAKTAAGSSKTGKSQNGGASSLAAAAKGRGWLAHGSTTIASSSNLLASSIYKGKRKASTESRADIHRSVEDGIYDADETHRHGSRSRSSTARSSTSRNSRASRSHRVSSSRAEGLYSIYDEQEDEDDDGEQRSLTSRSRSSSLSASSVTDSDSESDDPRRSRRHGSATTRRSSHSSRNRARNMTSTLRDPLLRSAGGGRRMRTGGGDRGTSSGSDTDASDQAYRSTSHRSRSHHPPHLDDTKEEQDAVDEIYVYPSPPARSGWGPWANRLAFGKYRDKTAIATFVAAICATVLVGLYMSWGARTPSSPKTPRTRPSSYYTITRSLPILILLTLLSFGAGLGNLIMLRNLSRLGGTKVLRSGLMSIPLVLGLGWTWAFAGSFIYDDEAWSGGGWSTTGLRIISVIPLALAVLFARMVWSRRKALSRSIAVLELSCSVVLQHPALLVLAAASLGVFVLVTIPFLYLFTRLFLVGHFGKQVGDSVEWRTDAKAAWFAWATLLTWFWTWAVLRGIQRVTVAGVVSHWYFNRITDAAVDGGNAATPDAGPSSAAAPQVIVDKRQADEAHKTHSLPYDEEEDSIYAEDTPTAPGAYHRESSRRRSAGYAAAPDPTEVVRVSFARATGPALGSICMAALVLAVVRTATLAAEMARRISNATSERRVPKLLQPLTHVVALLAGVGAVLQGYSDLALVYVGVTGDGFWSAAKKSASVVGRRGVKGVMEGLVIHLVLDLTAVALSFLTGLAGFLFSAHQLHVPADAPLVGLLCAILPYWTLRLCADVLTNASDTLYLCYAIDQASNDEHCPKVAQAFTVTQDVGSESVLPF